MKLHKIFLFPFSISLLSGCGSTNTSSSEKYLKLGETVSTGYFSQTLTELNYIPSSATDPNQTTFQIVYDLHYSGNHITPLSSYSYSGIFDGNENFGSYSSVYSKKAPDSIAPDQTVSITLGFQCFKDWKEAVIEYRGSNEEGYTFKLRNSDFGYPTNNLFASPKAGESVTAPDGTASVQVLGMEKTIIGSAYAGNDDNVMVSFGVTNHTSENLNFKNFSFTFDNGLSVGNVSWSSDTQPTSVPANSSIYFSLILIIQTKDWKNCVVETTFKQTTTLKFNLHHSDYNY